MINQIRSELTQFCGQISSVRDELPPTGKLVEVVRRIGIVVGYLFARSALFLINLFCPPEKIKFTAKEISKKLDTVAQKFLNCQGKVSEKQDSKIFICLNVGDIKEHRIILINNSQFDSATVGEIYKSIITQEIEPLMQGSQKLGFSAELFIRHEKAYDQISWSKQEDSKDWHLSLLLSTKKSLELMDIWLKGAAKKCGCQGDEVEKQLDSQYQFTSVVPV